MAFALVLAMRRMESEILCEDAASAFHNLVYRVRINAEAQKYCLGRSSYRRSRSSIAGSRHVRGMETLERVQVEKYSTESDLMQF